MKTKSTTLLLTALLATSSAFGAINIGDTIGNTIKHYTLTTFDYSETGTTAGGTRGGTGDWLRDAASVGGNSENWDTPLPSGQGQMIKTGLADGRAVAVGRATTGATFTDTDRATHVQLVFTLGSNTTVGKWQIGGSPVFGGNSMLKNDITFNQADIDAEEQFILTIKITNSHSAGQPDGNGTYSLANYATNGGFFWSFTNMNTSGAANLAITFNEARFVTEQIVPEPATYGLILGGLLFGYIMIRRRNRK